MSFPAFFSTSLNQLCTTRWADKCKHHIVTSVPASLAVSVYWFQPHCPGLCCGCLCVMIGSCCPSHFLWRAISLISSSNPSILSLMKFLLPVSLHVISAIVSLSLSLSGLSIWRRIYFNRGVRLATSLLSLCLFLCGSSLLCSPPSLEDGSSMQGQAACLTLPSASDFVNGRL